MEAIPQSASKRKPKLSVVQEAEPIRVLLADDHAMMRRSLHLLLAGESDIEVIAEVHDHPSVTEQVDIHQPHVLVLDLRMSGASSIETIRALGDRAPKTKIVVLTMEESPVFAQHALAAGASAMVSKDRAKEELPEAVRMAARGETYVSPRVAARLSALEEELSDKLSQREVEVLRLIALGHTSVEVAHKLQLSPRTIETHRAHIHTKLGLTTRAELVDYALGRGLIGV
jgi:two-component system, NarL family, response regulator NreC